MNRKASVGGETTTSRAPAVAATTAAAVVAAVAVALGEGAPVAEEGKPAVSVAAVSMTILETLEEMEEVMGEVTVGPRAQWPKLSQWRPEPEAERDRCCFGSVAHPCSASSAS